MADTRLASVFNEKKRWSHCSLVMRRSGSGQSSTALKMRHWKYSGCSLNELMSLESAQTAVRQYSDCQQLNKCLWNIFNANIFNTNKDYENENKKIYIIEGATATAIGNNQKQSKISLFECKRSSYLLASVASVLLTRTRRSTSAVHQKTLQCTFKSHLQFYSFTLQKNKILGSDKSVFLFFFSEISL